MMIMTNAEAFHYDFGIYATELWAMSEDEFLAWLNASCERERPKDMIVRCKDCRNAQYDSIFDLYYCNGNPHDKDFFCKNGDRRTEE